MAVRHYDSNKIKCCIYQSIYQKVTKNMKVGLFGNQGQCHQVQPKLKDLMNAFICIWFVSGYNV